MTPNEEAILNKLTGEFRRLAELVGVETALKISEAFGGTWINVPKLDALRTAYRDRLIRAEYDAAPNDNKMRAVKAIARKYHLTARHIFNILKKYPDEAKEPVVLPLFLSLTKK